MPYRRLPNTDSARLRALQTALSLGNDTPPYKLAYSPSILINLRKLVPAFESSLKQQKISLASQSTRVKDFDEIARKARIYLSHFLRVMNMAIYRGELPPETRTFYGIEASDSTLPPLNSDNELASWGKRVIEGEAYRIRKGGSPITNPTIAVVKVWYEKFMEALDANRLLEEKAAVMASRTAEIRKQADEIILNIWNDVEKHFSGLPDNIKREKCCEYGVVYYHRKSELAVTGNPE